MPVTDDLVDALLGRVATAPREDLRAVLRALDLAREAVILRLLEPEAPRLVPIEEAAELVALPVRRLRSIARGKPWSHRIGRSVRIDVAGLLAHVRSTSPTVANGTQKPVPTFGARSQRRQHARKAG